MDGENNGKPYEQMNDLGVPLFLETPMYHYASPFHDGEIVKLYLRKLRAKNYISRLLLRQFIVENHSLYSHCRSTTQSYSCQILAQVNKCRRSLQMIGSEKPADLSGMRLILLMEEILLTS